MSVGIIFPVICIILVIYFLSYVLILFSKVSNKFNVHILYFLRSSLNFSIVVMDWHPESES